MPTKCLSANEVLEVMQSKTRGRPYIAMYSTWFGGIVKDPHLMFLPIDEHMVHRGDGVFEAMRFTKRGIFEMDAHINRLFVSAEKIHLEVPHTKLEIESLCKELALMSGVSDGMLRLFVSRGPGDFSPNPYSTDGSQFYLVVMPFVPASVEKYEKGAKAIISSVPAKPGYFAQVKSCNYLTNVMTKKESIDNNADFAINVTSEGRIAEGPTENILILDKNMGLFAPGFDYTLRGTTLMRTLEIAERLKAELNLTDIGTKSMAIADLDSAREIMMVGTTLGAMPVTNIGNKAVGDGKVGSVAMRLHQELMKLI